MTLTSPLAAALGDPSSVLGPGWHQADTSALVGRTESLSCLLPVLSPDCWFPLETCLRTAQSPPNHSYRMASSPTRTPNTQSAGASGNINLGPSANPNARPTDFDFLKVIGKGSYGKVLLAKHKSDGMFYAVKVLQKKSILKNKEVPGPAHLLFLSCLQRCISPRRAPRAWVGGGHSQGPGGVQGAGPPQGRQAGRPATLHPL